MVGLPHDHTGIAIKPMNESCRTRGFDPECLFADSCNLWPGTLVNATEGSPQPRAVTHFNQGSEQNNIDSGETDGQNVDGGDPSRRAMD